MEYIIKKELLRSFVIILGSFFFTNVFTYNIGGYYFLVWLIPTIIIILCIMYFIHILSSKKNLMQSKNKKGVLDKNKTIKLNLINSSVAIDLIFIIFIVCGGFITGVINLYLYILVLTLLILSIYHASWNTIIINKNGIEIRSSLSIISPIRIPFSEFKKTKYTGFSFVIDYSNFKNKIKMDLIYPIWAEFLTIKASPDFIKKAIDIIHYYKKSYSD